ncbi:MAG: DUF4358 domain-containing protein [Clostridia bacterium]|nr:DUF4358 domain-containing protein [Clostridia bacterium]
MVKPDLRVSVLCVICALAVLLASGCSASKGARQFSSTDELSQTLVEKINMDNVVKVSGDKLIKHYNLSSDIFEDATAYISQNEDVTDQVAVFRLKNDSDYNQVYDQIGSRLNQLANSYKDHSPVEYKKISGAIIKVLNDDLIFIICDKPSLALEAVSEMGAEDYIKGE